MPTSLQMAAGDPALAAAVRRSRQLLHRRALVAARLARDLQVSCADLGLVLDLLDEIGRLQALLKQRGVG